jgi:hypothetical protein
VILMARVVLALWLGHASVRLYWAGVSTSGKAPRALQEKVLTQLGISVGPLGLRLGPAGSSVEASARCDFGGERASCFVSVLDRSAQRRAERRAEIPYRDADDFAQTLALMVVDALVVDLRVVDPGAAPPAAAETEPTKDTPTEKLPETPPPPVPVPVAPPKPVHEVRAAPAPTPIAPVTPSEPGRIVLSLGPALAIDSDAAPALYGVDVRLLWSRRWLLVGGALKLAGTSTTEKGYGLDFLRTVAGPRLGLVTRHGGLTADISAGPALLVISTNAQPGGSHTLTAFAGMAGVSASYAFSRSFGLQLAVDEILPATRQRITAGPTQVAEFGLVSLEVSLALVYRM